MTGSVPTSVSTPTSVPTSGTISAAGTPWSRTGDIAYPMPDRATVPSGIPAWSPDPARAILLVHDMQRYFLDRFRPGEDPVRTLEANVERLVGLARKAGIPVVYTAQPGDMTARERGLLADFWGPGMTTSERQRAIPPRYGPHPDDVVITKWRYSAFARTRLGDLMTSAGRDQLIVTGVYGHVGILATALDAYTRDVQCFLVWDAISDFSLDDHRRTLVQATATCAVPCSTGQVRQAVTGAAG